MVPNNPQLSIQIPSEVEVSNIQTNLSFYGSYIFINLEFKIWSLCLEILFYLA